ncbi:MAG: PxKF domain-containing protein [Vicinamibacterales bacterium]
MSTLGLGLFLILGVLVACSRTVSAPAAELSTLANGTCEATDETLLRQYILDDTCSTISVTTGITLTGGQLLVERDVTITGPEDSPVTIDASGLSRVLEVARDTNVTLRNLTLTGGYWYYGTGGGGILNAGSLTIQDSAVTANRADQNGGGIYNSGTLILLGTTVSDNKADEGDGGGIFNELNGILEIQDSAVTRNLVWSGWGIGGGIYSSGTLIVDNGTITENGAVFMGGGVFSGSYRYSEGDYLGGGGPVTITRSLIAGNTAPEGMGGGLCLAASDVTITESTISDNGAYAAGGLANLFGALTLERSTVSANSATIFAGGIASHTDAADTTQHTTILNSTISGNLVPFSVDEPYLFGGGILNVQGTTRIILSTVTDNHAHAAGGGVHAIAETSTIVKSSLIWGNTSGTDTADDLATGSTLDNALVSLGHNLVGAAGDFSGAFDATDQSGDLVAMIGPLLPNVPGTTATHALLAGSPALDTGSCTDHDDAVVTTDQRGVARPQGSACDVGAFELEATAPVHATGFYPPIGESNSVFVPDGTAPSPGPDTVWNLATGGSTIPLKFNLYEYDGGPEITSTADIVFGATTVACPSGGEGDDPVDFTTTGSTSLRYDATEGLFIQNWKTRKAGRDTCYLVSVSFADDSALFAFIRLHR